MKAIKMLGLAALTALMAMAFVGAPSAMAEPTALCKHDTLVEVGPGKYEEAECPIIEDENKEILLRVVHVHEETLKEEPGTLLNSISNVLCHVLFLGDVLSKEYLGNPLIISGKFTYDECKDEKPNTCTVEELNGPATIEVLKEGHELAKVTGKGEVKVVCSGISCVYNGEKLIGHALGPLLAELELNGETIINKQETHKVKGLLCPSTATLDLKVTPLEKIYITE